MRGALPHSRGFHSGVGASASASNNERQDNEPGAMGFGETVRASARRNEGAYTMVRRDSRMAGEKFVPAKKISPVFVPLNEPDAAKEFSAVILPFSVGELAQATNRSKETAKCWKQGRAFPNGVSLMALMAEFPAISAWVEGKTGGTHTPQGMAMMFGLLEKVMASNTPEGRAMRARFQQLISGGE